MLANANFYYGTACASTLARCFWGLWPDNAATRTKKTAELRVFSGILYSVQFSAKLF